jgi:hypothetical protein
LLEKYDCLFMSRCARGLGNLTYRHAGKAGRESVRLPVAQGGAFPRWESQSLLSPLLGYRIIRRSELEAFDAGWVKQILRFEKVL